MTRCSTFGSEDPGDTGEAGASDSDTRDAAPGDAVSTGDGGSTPTLSTRTSVAESSAVSATLPAGAAVGDLVVAFWCARDARDSDMLPQLNSGWTELGTGTALQTYPNPQETGGFWSGYRWLLPGESQDTTYPFAIAKRTSHIAVTLAVIPGVRASQPITPTQVETTTGEIGDGKLVVNLPAITGRGNSLALFGVCSFAQTPFPLATGFDRLETSSDFALYSAQLANGVTLMGPALAVGSAAPAQSITLGTASLGVVIGP